MTPLEFLAVVLPSSGRYCIAEVTTPKKQHVYTETLEQAYAVAQEFDEKQYDVYFALSTFKEDGSRKADNAQNTRSLYLDIDCGENKGYATKEQAAAELQSFVQRAGFPNPYVVSSGYGLHVYWPFKDETTADKAALLGTKFKRLVARVDNVDRRDGDGGGDGDDYEYDGADAGGDGPAVREVPSAAKFRLNIDLAVTGDATRILRVPGTRNWKQRPDCRYVELLAEGETCSFEQLYRLVDSLLPPEDNIPDLFEHLHAPVGGRLPRSAVQELAILNSTVAFTDILKASERGEGCKQIEYYIDHAQQDGMEPLWRAVLSIAKYCIDGDKAVKKVSALHPYDAYRTQIKVNQIQGPYPCHKFESENPGICRTCKHWGRLTNPLGIARKTITIDTETTLEVLPAVVPAAEEEAQPIQITRPAPPKGYEYGTNGGVYEIKKEKDSKGELQECKNLILAYDAFVVDLLSTEGRHNVNLATIREGRISYVSIPQKSIVSKDETLKALSEANILASNFQDVQLHRYIRACVSQASENSMAVSVPSSCGWQEDGSFVYDGRVFTPDGERAFPMPGLENIFKASAPTGSLEDWRAILNMLVGRREHQILAMSLIGFAAPLMRFTGLYGMTFHLGSTESGTGKTLAIELAASVWGDPVKSRTTVDTSSIATLNRLGLLGSLPLCTDEITSKNRSDFEWLPGFLFSVTEGHGKERMESGANKERINNTYWQSLVLLSSNTHVMDYLTGARKHSSEGEVRRILELTLNKPMQLAPHDVELIKSLRRNYGYAGERWVRWLVRNTAVAEKVVKDTYNSLYEDFSASNDERFWLAGCTAIVAAGVLVGRRYADIVDLPMQAIVDVLREMVWGARKMVKESLRTAEDILNSFVRQFYGKLVVVRKIESGTMLAKLGGASEIDESITRSDVMGRVEHMEDGFVELFIEESLMRSFCASMSYGYADFKRHIAKQHAVKFSSKNLLAHTKGPPMVCKVIQITRRAIEIEQ